MIPAVQILRSKSTIILIKEIDKRTFLTVEIRRMYQAEPGQAGGGADGGGNDFWDVSVRDWRFHGEARENSVQISKSRSNEGRQI